MWWVHPPRRSTKVSLLTPLQVSRMILFKKVTSEALTQWPLSDPLSSWKSWNPVCLLTLADRVPNMDKWTHPRSSAVERVNCTLKKRLLHWNQTNSGTNPWLPVCPKSSSSGVLWFLLQSWIFNDDDSWMCCCTLKMSHIKPLDVPNLSAAGPE